MGKLIHTFLADESGATTFEYGVIFGLMCVVGLGWLPRLMLK